MVQEPPSEMSSTPETEQLAVGSETSAPDTVGQEPTETTAAVAGGQEPELSSSGADPETREQQATDGAVPAEPAVSAQAPSPRRGVRPITWVLWGVVLLLLVLIGVAGVMIYRTMPEQGEAPQTAAQAAVDKAMAGVKAKPKDFYQRLVLADAYYQFQRYSEAIKTLEDARSLAKKPEEKSYIEVGLARSYDSMGNRGAAVKQYTASLKIKETFDALYGLGTIAKEEGRPSEAIDYWLRALKVNPGMATLRLDVEQLYEAQKRYDLALEQLNEAARYLPDDPDVTKAIARVKPLAGQPTVESTATK